MDACQRVLVTGANGFVGSALTRVLIEAGFHVRMIGQSRPPDLGELGGEWFPFPDLTGDVDWEPALDGMDAVVHLAGIAHRFESDIASDWDLYDRVNHLATRCLVSALQGHASVKRFLFTSSVRVHGDPVVFPVEPDSPLRPVTPYDQSKADAEAAVASILGPTGITWAILRPVVVYGPGNRGNMARLEGLLRRGIPIPVGRNPNRRSFLFIGNLVSAIQTFLTASHPPSGHAWIVSDEGIESTETLLRAMAKAMDVAPKILHLPNGFLDLTAKAGDVCRRLSVPAPWNSEIQSKLLGDFYINLEPIKRELGWKPPFTMEEGFRLTFNR